MKIFVKLKGFPIKKKIMGLGIKIFVDSTKIFIPTPIKIPQNQKPL